MADAIEEIYCNTAESFLKKLDIGNNLWEALAIFGPFEATPMMRHMQMR